MFCMTKRLQDELYDDVRSSHNEDVVTEVVSNESFCPLRGTPILKHLVWSPKWNFPTSSLSSISSFIDYRLPNRLLIVLVVIETVLDSNLLTFHVRESMEEVVDLRVSSIEKVQSLVTVDSLQRPRG